MPESFNTCRTMSSVWSHSSGSSTYFFPRPSRPWVLKRIWYFSMPKIWKYLRYISFTALNSAANCSAVQ
jgi:hypothetical protein